ncbi:MAG: hypoxanthine phosphoribosyltransferase [Oscillospiraceae bacterium]|nr:hypoxanthine phosphoribosyltransferase [Oscillospiraceae bacterium]
MNKDIESILFTEAEIKAKVKEIGEQITKDFAGKNVVLVGVLKGAFVFLSDLVRCIDLDCSVDFLTASSYGKGAVSSGKVTIAKDVGGSLEGKDVIVVEDILDSGVTMTFLKKYLAERNPESISVCTLLDKPDRRITDVKADYFGFISPNEFLVGYGLDYAEKYRNLPYIGILKPEIYN